MANMLVFMHEDAEDSEPMSISKELSEVSVGDLSSFEK